MHALAYFSSHGGEAFVFQPTPTIDFVRPYTLLYGMHENQQTSADSWRKGFGFSITMRSFTATSNLRIS